MLKVIKNESIQKDGGRSSHGIYHNLFMTDLLIYNYYNWLELLKRIANSFRSKFKELSL